MKSSAFLSDQIDPKQRSETEPQELSRRAWSQATIYNNNNLCLTLDLEKRGEKKQSLWGGKLIHFKVYHSGLVSYQLVPLSEQKDILEDNNSIRDQIWSTEKQQNWARTTTHRHTHTETQKNQWAVLPPMFCDLSLPQ